ncbi:hypothetical protein [Kitasatospora sp. NPDC059571]|uniref:hypothetical protein n=1 Tax=Kitasatospora sp. NPDC059571 TaxID=3346871 RepID=UPI00367B894A
MTVDRRPPEAPAFSESRHDVPVPPQTVGRSQPAREAVFLAPPAEAEQAVPAVRRPPASTRPFSPQAGA